jgi:hypothetical protein
LYVCISKASKPTCRWTSGGSFLLLAVPS